MCNKAQSLIDKGVNEMENLNNISAESSKALKEVSVLLARASNIMHETGEEESDLLDEIAYKLRELKSFIDNRGL